MTAKGIVKLIKFVQGCYMREFTQEQVAAWNRAFNGYFDDQILNAAEVWVSDCEHFPPNAADLCRVANEIMERGGGEITESREITEDYAEEMRRQAANGKAS